MTNLEAGTELDRLVAEHVMEYSSGVEWPLYSEDLKAAFKIVEKMEANGFWFTLTRCTANRPDLTPYWYARFRCVTDGIGKAYEKKSTSVPHAICLAALAATVPPCNGTCNTIEDNVSFNR